MPIFMHKWTTWRKTSLHVNSGHSCAARSRVIVIFFLPLFYFFPIILLFCNEQILPAHKNEMSLSLSPHLHTLSHQPFRESQQEHAAHCLPVEKLRSWTSICPHCMHCSECRTGTGEGGVATEGTSLRKQREHLPGRGALVLTSSLAGILVVRPTHAVNHRACLAPRDGSPLAQLWSWSWHFLSVRNSSALNRSWKPSLAPQTLRKWAPTLSSGLISTTQPYTLAKHSSNIPIFASVPPRLESLAFSLVHAFLPGPF